jgi:hypothetical protein
MIPPMALSCKLSLFTTLPSQTTWRLSSFNFLFVEHCCNQPFYNHLASRKLTGLLISLDSRLQLSKFGTSLPENVTKKCGRRHLSTGTAIHEHQLRTTYEPGFQYLKLFFELVKMFSCASRIPTCFTSGHTNPNPLGGATRYTMLR